ncbi:MAG: CDP-glycerol glycerophosphotransferase family protein [Lachnospiraceae bacterium]|nr:CDP-glycerol glycerophosphotransferase family protein [Lachnospiraceae bacterium]
MNGNGILLYIDPGTGSMLFTILLGIVGTGMFFAKKLMLKIKFRLSGGKVDAVTGESMPYVMFSDSKTYWNTFRPICDEFEKRGLDAVYWTASPDDPALKTDYKHVKCEFIGEGNKAFAKLNMMKADICLATTPNLDVFQWKRSRDVKFYAHVMHSAATTLLYRMFGMDFYDAILLTGDFQTEEVRELEKIRKDKEKELRVVGCPYLDELKKRLDEYNKEDTAAAQSDRKTILLAPSWGETAILKKYGEKILSALIKTGYKIIVRPHPQSSRSEKDMLDKLMKEYPENEDLEWNFDTDNFEALRRADLMITDFSAVILDFALVFNKPVIYTEYKIDKAVYDAAWIEHDLWQEDTFPKLGAPLKEEQFDDMKTVIDSVIESDVYADGRNKAREEAWAHIGHSAEEIVNYLTEKSKALTDQ